MQHARPSGSGSNGKARRWQSCVHWLRPGNTGSANNVIGFLHATREHLAGKTIGLLRADSGFCEDAFLAHLEGEPISYIIALKLNQPLQRALGAGHPDRLPSAGLVGARRRA